MRARAKWRALNDHDARLRAGDVLDQIRAFIRREYRPSPARPARSLPRPAPTSRRFDNSSRGFRLPASATLSRVTVSDLPQVIAGPSTRAAERLVIAFQAKVDRRVLLEPVVTEHDVAGGD